MTDLSVVGIGLKFRYTLQMLIIFLCNCITTSGNSCLHKNAGFNLLQREFQQFCKTLEHPSAFFWWLVWGLESLPMKMSKAQEAHLEKASQRVWYWHQYKPHRKIMPCSKPQTSVQSADTVHPPAWLDSEEVSARRIKVSVRVWGSWRSNRHYHCVSFPLWMHVLVKIIVFQRQSSLHFFNFLELDLKYTVYMLLIN